MPMDWIVGERRVGEIRATGVHWLDDAADWPIVRNKPLPGETEVRDLHLGPVPGQAGAFVFRGPYRREGQVVGWPNRCESARDILNELRDLKCAVLRMVAATEKVARNTRLRQPREPGPQ